jgi:hypothetical protein
MNYRTREFKINGGEVSLLWFRPEAEPRAIQIEGYFYPDKGGEIRLPERTYYAEASESSAVTHYLRLAQELGVS